MKCPNCKSDVPPRQQKGGAPKKFCSRTCGHRFNAKKYCRKMQQIDPTWNATRQRKLRAKYPEHFAKTMARYYLRKLSKEKIAELLKEVGY